MSLMEELTELGVNVDEALVRFMNKASLYERMLGKLADAVNSTEVMPAFEAQDFDTALSNAHTLKGVMGNLSITPLYSAYTNIVKLLREGKPEQARKVLEETLPVQEKIINCIEKYK